MQKFDLNALKSMEKRFRANFVNSLSGFKSANLVGTKSISGQTNLCIISSAFHLGADPALMGFISRPHSVDRHTLEYLLETKYYTLNHVNADIVEQAHQTSARYPREQSEFSATGLNEEYFDGFHAPYVEQAHLKIGLKLVESHTLLNDTVFVIGAIENVHLPGSAVSKDGHIDIEKLGTVAVSGLDHYHNTSSIMRLSYAKPDKAPSKINNS